LRSENHCIIRRIWQGSKTVIRHGSNGDFDQRYCYNVCMIASCKQHQDVLFCSGVMQERRRPKHASHYGAPTTSRKRGNFGE
jgi:hypothetical protein